ncbi:LysR family transcriptional regulator [Novosphingobium sp. SL115]|uniref:LysR family transcriptional regulator n=1 Tax=Novosphingobium sp. SL115 TaxID=2995150 RepID=UPI0022768743|nr:LysR family transcriptional regulator [Novosphingobium sp. SL115]MCY1672925.1 LysR family transcriptional regulator [Novosphingobium sp. SL115]
MNIAKLERLIAVYEAGSFRKAAKTFGISQPALTWSIRQLEESLNLPLFVRGPRGIKPTEPCERLIVRARLIVSEQARLLAEVERSNRVQTLELGVHPILVTPAFARALAQFRAAHDDVTIQIVDGYSAQLQERLRQGGLDLAICATAAQTEHEAEFDFEPLLRQSYSVYAAADHPIFAEIAAGIPLSPRGWAQVAVPNVPVQQTGSEDILHMLQGVGMTPAKAMIRSPSMQLIRTLVEHGDVLGMLPDDFIQGELASGAIRLVEGTQMDAPPLGLLTVAGSYQSRALRRLMSILRQTFRSPSFK